MPGTVHHPFIPKKATQHSHILPQIRIGENTPIYYAKSVYVPFSAFLKLWPSVGKSYLTLKDLLKTSVLLHTNQGRIQPVSLRGVISEKFGSQVSLRVHYCKKDEVYFTTLLWQNNRCQNGLISRMLFSELCKIMVNKVTFVGFKGAIAPPLDSPLAQTRPCRHVAARPVTWTYWIKKEDCYASSLTSITSRLKKPPDTKFPPQVYLELSAGMLGPPG